MVCKGCCLMALATYVKGLASCKTRWPIFVATVENQTRVTSRTMEAETVRVIGGVHFHYYQCSGHLTKLLHLRQHGQSDCLSRLWVLAGDHFAVFDHVHAPWLGFDEVCAGCHQTVLREQFHVAAAQEAFRLLFFCV